MSLHGFSLMVPWVARGVGAVVVVLGLLAFKFPRIRHGISPWVLVVFGGVFLLVGAPVTPTFLNI